MLFPLLYRLILALYSIQQFLIARNATDNNGRQNLYPDILLRSIQAKEIDGTSHFLS